MLKMIHGWAIPKRNQTKRFINDAQLSDTKLSDAQVMLNFVSKPSDVFVAMDFQLTGIDCRLIT